MMKLMTVPIHNIQFVHRFLLQLPELEKNKLQFLSVDNMDVIFSMKPQSNNMGNSHYTCMCF